MGMGLRLVQEGVVLKSCTRESGTLYVSLLWTDRMTDRHRTKSLTFRNFLSGR